MLYVDIEISVKVSVMYNKEAISTFPIYLI